MRGEKKKSICKTRKNPTRPAKRTRSKAFSRKKKPMMSQSQTAGVRAVEAGEIEIIANIEPHLVDKTEVTVIDPKADHYPLE